MLGYRCIIFYLSIPPFYTILSEVKASYNMEKYSTFSPNASHGEKNCVTSKYILKAYIRVILAVLQNHSG